MSIPLEFIVYGTSVAVGIGSAAIIHWHRGYYEKVEGVSIADGEGFSSRLRKKLPEGMKKLYSEISSGLEHFFFGLGITAGYAGVAGLVASTANYLFNGPGIDMMVPYYIGGIVAPLVGLIEPISDFFRYGRKAAKGDAIQFIGDTLGSTIGLVLGYIATNAIQ